MAAWMRVISLASSSRMIFSAVPLAWLSMHDIPDRRRRLFSLGCGEIEHDA